jgi:subtilisin family serine protease
MSELGDDKRHSARGQIALPLDRLAARVPIAEDPVIDIAPELLARYNARILDPTAAKRVSDQEQIRSTIYLAGKLLVSGAARTEARESLDAAAGDLSLRLEPPAAFDEHRSTLVAAARSARVANADDMFVSVHEVLPVEKVAAVPDAFDVVQSYRARVGLDADDAKHVALDHLLISARHITPGPFDDPNGVIARATGSYAQPGWGGRQPVNWLGDPPVRNPKFDQRRPVVAVLDTGVGEHDWFPLDPETVVHRNPTFNGALIGLGEPDATERTGVIKHPLEGVLDAYSGHGTFIAGLIHQQCPDADILSVRVMPSEGAVPEHVLHDALTMVLCRQQAALAKGEQGKGELIDVVSLSLGYYPETLGAPSVPPFLFEPIDALGRCGVAVVVSAGNDATSRPMYPAAFTPHAGGYVSASDPHCVPVVSVAAQNPDGSIALFSNAGSWVTCAQPGAALVSTFPKFEASGQAAYAFRGPDGWRSTIDPDNFASGFGVWSGTSFAAPVLAGKIARVLADGTCGSTNDLGQDAMVQRCWAAVRKHVSVKT